MRALDSWPPNQQYMHDSGLPSLAFLNLDCCFHHFVRIETAGAVDVASLEEHLITCYSSARDFSAEEVERASRPSSWNIAQLKSCDGRAKSENATPFQGPGKIGSRCPSPACKRSKTQLPSNKSSPPLYIYIYIYMHAYVNISFPTHSAHIYAQHEKAITPTHSICISIHVCVVGRGVTALSHWVLCTTNETYMLCAN